jgi:ElaB/YqjD/DUF883 family membrane-anchored ribosome-binding protein
MSDMARTKYPPDLVRAAEQSRGVVEDRAKELIDSLERYAREKPLHAALWALGIGFFLGWRLKPW